MVSKRTRDRVAKAARSMGYVRNELVSSMMSSMKKNAFGAFAESVALINGNIDELCPHQPPDASQVLRRNQGGGKASWVQHKRILASRPAPERRNSRKDFPFARHTRRRDNGHSADNVFPAEYESVWRDFYFISVGIQTFNPTLEMVSADQYAVAYGRPKKAVELGYKRPRS